METQPGSVLVGELILDGTRFPIKFRVGTDSAIHVPEPIYDLVVAASLIPCAPDTLRLLLWRMKHIFPPLYRPAIVPGKRRRSRKRVVRATEILRLRSMVLYGPGAPALKEDGQLIGYAHIYPRSKRESRSYGPGENPSRDWASYWKAKARGRGQPGRYRVHGEGVPEKLDQPGQSGAV